MNASLFCTTPTNNVSGVAWCIVYVCNLDVLFKVFNSRVLQFTKSIESRTLRRRKKQHVVVVRELPTMDLRRSTRIAAKVGPSTNPAPRTSKEMDSGGSLRVVTQTPSVPKPKALNITKDSKVSNNLTVPVAGPSKPKAKDLKKKLKVPRTQQSSSVSKRGAPTKRSMAFLEAESRQGFHGFEPTSAMVRIISKFYFCIFCCDAFH